MGFNLFAVGKTKPEIETGLTEFFFLVLLSQVELQQGCALSVPCFLRGVERTFATELLLSKNTEALDSGRGERIQNGKIKSNSLKKRSGPNFNIKY